MQGGDEAIEGGARWWFSRSERVVSRSTCHIRQTRQTRVTGMGFAGVTNCQPVPIPVTARDLNP